MLTAWCPSPAQENAVAFGGRLSCYMMMCTAPCSVPAVTGPRWLLSAGDSCLLFDILQETCGEPDWLTSALQD